MKGLIPFLHDLIFGAPLKPVCRKGFCKSYSNPDCISGLCNEHCDFYCAKKCKKKYADARALERLYDGGES